MKKLFMAAMAAMCVFATSCTNKIENAYELECCYRSVKDAMGGSAAAEKYKEEFLSIWCTMTDDERTEYANYKSCMEIIGQRERAVMEEGLRELNN